MYVEVCMKKECAVLCEWVGDEGMCGTKKVNVWSGESENVIKEHEWVLVKMKSESVKKEEEVKWKWM